MIEVRQTEGFAKWLNTLKDRSARLRILDRLERLAAGHFGDAKSIGNGVSELRIFAGPGYRVYFTRVGNKIVILLCGGDKSSQRQDIKRAKALAKE